MTLTDEQKLEMTETIHRACWPEVEFEMGDFGAVWVNEHGGLVSFNPFSDWNDAMRAREALLPLGGLLGVLRPLPHGQSLGSSHDFHLDPSRMWS